MLPKQHPAEQAAVSAYLVDFPIDVMTTFFRAHLTLKKESLFVSHAKSGLHFVITLRLMGTRETSRIGERRKRQETKFCGSLLFLKQKNPPFCTW